jgi:predicted TIM-barrel fold metal-dependent hydrolase
VTQVDDASKQFPNVYVDFSGEIHKFQFPGAIKQGFLKIE